MHDSATAPERVRARFEERARQFDDLYEDERRLVRTLRPGLFRRRQLAVQTVEAYQAPKVLDVGCGSGRIGEFVLVAGAARYVGVDFSAPMIDLATQRLVRFQDRTQLIVNDFLTAPVEGPFDVILALGLFDYLPEPHLFTRRMFTLTASGGCVVGSFPTWSWLKGPVRKVRYEWIGNCPIFNYSRRELELMFGASGFDRVDIASPGRSGYLVRAYRT
ncbi:MAG: class I SAM-dependent methyltransferase [Solirubrobacterales bacterium]|nr:class I SAM-dependent methyltransferase [Solirubrobacterales bacterium]MBV9943389.1 class I SAM-dependent methyltransferase [Solirubrobacterales bacterium]